MSHSARTGRRGRRRDIGEKANHERWVISYADMLTLLLAVFIVLWASSREDISRIRMVAASIMKAFTGHPPAVRNLPATPHDPWHALPKPVSRPIMASGTPVRAEQHVTSGATRNQAADHAPPPLPVEPQLLSRRTQLHLQPSVFALDKLERELEQLLQPEITTHQIAILAHPLSVRIRLNAKVLFKNGHAKLTPSAIRILTPLGDVLGKLPAGYMITVQGYTDNAPIHTAKYPSNWELSTARAVSVVKLLLSDHVPGTSLSAQGFSQYKPIASNQTTAGRALNRRVEILITAPPKQHSVPAADGQPASNEGTADGSATTLWDTAGPARHIDKVRASPHQGD